MWSPAEFRRDESGAASIFSLFAAASLLVLGGIAVDGANAWMVRNQLQIAADAAALAAVTRIDAEDEARALAVEVAAKNMGEDPDADTLSIAPKDVIFGHWTAGGEFLAETAPINAVKVDAKRTVEQGNPVKTFLLGLAGQDSFSVVRASVATVEATNACLSGTIITSDFLDIGGGNNLTESVCLHGQAGARTAGNDLVSPAAHVSAGSLASITLGSLRAGSTTRERIAVEQTLAPMILPELDIMFANLWSDLWIEDAEGSDLEPDGVYTGDRLPAHLRDEAGEIDIVIVDTGSWIVQPGELKPNTVYVVNHGVQFAAGVEAEKIAIIAKGGVGGGGGGQVLRFNDVFVFAEGELNLSGDILWGRAEEFCASGRYGSYLFSKETISMGGWGSESGLFGVVAAAPRFSPGGVLHDAGGIYVEAQHYTSLGGNMEFLGCDAVLEAEYEINRPSKRRPRLTY